MLFPFTFRLPVPGLSNPFASTSSTRTSTSTASPARRPPPTPVDSSRKHAAFHITRSRPSPDEGILSPVPGLSSSRKRAWDPSFAEPSQSTISLASTNGYLDTPSKYRDMVIVSSNRAIADEFHEVGMFANRDDTDLPPPAKRRRGLAGSIVSTAVNAALIGTAVGLTVYRLWRDRGKEPPRLEDPHHQQSPPPPYTLQDSHLSSTPSSPTKRLQIAPSPLPLPVTPSRSTTGRKTRYTAAAAGTGTANTPSSSAGRRRLHAYTPTRARTGTRGHAQYATTHVYNTAPTSQTPLFPAPRPEFDFGSGNTQEAAETHEVDDQMDWIGDKLTMLIEQGKRALGREVVVMSENKEDEVDDGRGGWEEVPTTTTHGSLPPSRSGSLRRTKRPRELMHSASASQLCSHSRSKSDVPQSSLFMTPPPQLSPPMSSRSEGFDFSTPSPAATSEAGEQEWESPELRELMERARARYRR